MATWLPTITSAAGIPKTTSPRENLIVWLRDAYAMEGQAIELLERQIERLEHYPEIRTKLQDHLNQTRGQQAALQQTFNLRGGALAAFQAGVSEALEAAEMPPTGWPARRSARSTRR